MAALAAAPKTTTAEESSALPAAGAALVDAAALAVQAVVLGGDRSVCLSMEAWLRSLSNVSSIAAAAVMVAGVERAARQVEAASAVRAGQPRYFAAVPVAPGAVAAWVVRVAAVAAAPAA